MALDRADQYDGQGDTELVVLCVEWHLPTLLVLQDLTLLGSPSPRSDMPGYGACVGDSFEIIADVEATEAEAPVLASWRRRW